MLRWLYRVVPVAVELVVLYSEGGKFLIGDLDALRVAAGVEFGMYGESLAGGGGADQVDRDFVAGQRLTSPVRRDLAEQAMLDLVPRAGPGREMADSDRQTGLRGQGAQFLLPQPARVAVGAAGVGGDEQPSDR